MDNQNGKAVFSSVCERCGRTLYEGEMLNICGKYVCEPCAEKCIFGEFSAPRRKKRNPSSFLHFIFSFHPGAGQMYLGLMKRGLFQMCLFYFCIYIAATVSSSFFGLFIPIICLYSFFDSLSLKRRIFNGENVEDELGGVAEFLNNNRSLVVLAIVLMLIVGIISSAFSFIADNYFARGEQSVEIYFDENFGHMVEDTAKNIENTVTHSVSVTRPGHGYRASIINSRIATTVLIGPILLIAIGMIILLKSRKKRRRHSGAPSTGGTDKAYDFYDSNK